MLDMLAQLPNPVPTVRITAMMDTFTTAVAAHPYLHPTLSAAFCPISFKPYKFTSETSHVHGGASTGIYSNENKI